MKVIAFDTYGGPDVLHLVEAPIPEVGSHQIRLQVFAAAINPHDVMVRAGDQEANFSSNARAPRRPGMDAAGVVDSIGADADTDLVEGDAVIAIVDPFSASGGAYAEYITVEVDQVVRSPPGATASEAATLPLNGLTAYGALQALSLHSGQTVWVTGAAGGVGGYAVQLAKTLGLNVIADAAADEVDAVRLLGADFVVARDLAQPSRPVLDIHPTGVDGIVDTALLQQRAIPALDGTGSIAVLRKPGQPGATDINVSGTDVIVTYPVITNNLHETSQLQHLSELAGNGQLTLRVADTYPAAQAADAHRRFEKGSILGRLVLTF